MLAMPVAAGISAIVWKYTNRDFTSVAALSAGSLVLGCMLLSRMAEPRARVASADLQAQQ
jgi:hypothetical protein